MTSQRNVVRTESGQEGVQAEDMDVTAKIVSAVADREGVDPMELDTRLYEAIDPDALSTLVEGASGTNLTLGFDYAGYRVTVVADEEVVVDVSPHQ